MTAERINNIIGELDDDVLRCEFDPAPKRRGRLLRIAAAAAVLLLGFGAAFGIAKAAEAANDGKAPDAAPSNEVVLPPSQVGTEGFLHTKIRAYSLTSALENSKAACIITVGDWLSEDPETSSTYFEAAIEEVISGSVPEHIVLCQYGDSKYTMPGSPLFTYGDKLLVFLKEVNWGSAGYENCYAPAGVDKSFFYIAETRDEARYAVNHNCLFSYNIESNDSGAEFEDLAGNGAVLDAVISAIAEHDPAAAKVIAKNAANAPNEFPLRIYRLEDVVEYIRGL